MVILAFAALFGIHLVQPVAANSTAVFTKYVHLNSKVTWNIASAMCLGIGGILVEPTTVAKQHALKEVTKGKGLNDYWLGIVRKKGDLVAAIGCQLIVNKPSNTKDSEKNCFLLKGSKWEGKDCDHEADFVCVVTTGEECRYSTEIGFAMNDKYDSESRTSAAPNLSVCRDLCSQHQNGDSLCWAAAYDSNLKSCKLYFNLNPFAYVLPDKISKSDSFLLQRSCYEYVENNEKYESKKTADEPLSCSAVRTILITNTHVTSDTYCQNISSSTCPPRDQYTTLPPFDCATCPTDTTIVCPKPPNCTTAPVEIVTANCDPCPRTNTECSTINPTTHTCPPCHFTKEPCIEVTTDPTIPCPVEISNLTDAEKQVLVDKILSSLKIDTKNISSVKRKYESASDPRPSAQGIGILGGILLVGLGLTLLAADFTTLMRDARACMNNIRSGL